MENLAHRPGEENRGSQGRGGQRELVWGSQFSESPG